MDKLRMRFKKTGRAVYISHLDLMRTLTRAFLRAEVKIKYSEGFNPHPNISIALPLSVGAESVCEIMDFKLAEEKSPAEIMEAMRTQLPEGIELLEVYESERKVKELKWLKVSGVFEYDDGSAKAKLPELRDFFGAESIVISKKTKRGIADSDIKPAIREISLSELNGDIMIEATVSAQEPTLNPELLAEALRQLSPSLAPDFAKFRRLEIFDEKMSVFR